MILTLDHNPILLYFVAQILPFLAIGSSFNWLLCPFATLHYFGFLSFPSLPFFYFKPLQNVWGSSCIFPSQILESVNFSSRSSGFLNWITVLETKIWVTYVLIITKVSLLLDSLSCQSWEQYACILTSTCTHICKYFYM